MILTFLDFEISGLNIETDEPLEYGLLRVDMRRGVILDMYSGLIMPDNRELLDEQNWFFQNSKLTLGDFKDAKPIHKEFIYNLNRLAENSDGLAGHNVLSYDIPLLESVIARIFDHIPFGHTKDLEQTSRLLKTKPVCDTMVDVELKGSKALAYAAFDLGFIAPEAHRALFDCLTSYEIAKRALAPVWNRPLKIVTDFVSQDVFVCGDGIPEAMFSQPFMRVQALVGYKEKDVAKKLGFYWDATDRAWLMRCRESKANDIMEALLTEGFKCQVSRIR